MSIEVIRATLPMFSSIGGLNFQTSDNERAIHISLVDHINNQIDDKKYMIYTRQMDELPMTRFTIGAGRFGFPEMVVTGDTSDEYVTEVFARMHVCMDQIDPKEYADFDVFDWVLFLNEAIKNELNSEGIYKFIPVDTEQFMYGVGLNARRWYGRNYQSAMVVQLLFSIDGIFPDNVNYPFPVLPQNVLPMVPFGTPNHGIPKIVNLTRPYVRHLN